MWNPFKQLKEEIQRIDSRVDDIVRELPTPGDFGLIQHQLGSINLEDVRNEMLSEQEQREYNASVATVFKSLIEPTIKRLIIKQEEFMSRYATNMDQLATARGTINGFFILLEEFERARNSHIEVTRPKGEPDTYNLFPEIPKVDVVSNSPS